MKNKMTPENLNKIQNLTKHTYQEILKMSDREFFSSITRLLTKGTLNKTQHDWLDKQRHSTDLDDYTLQALDTFGGTIIKNK